MREVAEGVWLLSGLVPHAINTYLIATPDGEVLIDAGIRWTAGRLLRQLRDRRLSMVALTHVHPDHQGAAARVCQRRNVPLACHDADADAMEGRRPMLPANAIVRLGSLLIAGPPWPVAVRWRGGEMVGEFRIVHAPGHTPGHCMLFRERDRVVIAGDVVANANMLRGFGHLTEPPSLFSVDREENRRSMRLLLELRPALMCFGHGPPSRDVAGLEALLDRMRPATPP